MATDTLQQSGTGIRMAILNVIQKEPVIIDWLSSNSGCEAHKEVMINRFLVAKLFRIVKDKNETIKQTK